MVRNISPISTFNKEQHSYLCRCDASPDDLDNSNAQLWTRDQTAALLKSQDVDLLWYDHGLVPDFQAHHYNSEVLT